MRKIQHYLRYGSSTDSKYFEEYQDKASTIVFNANILCHHTKKVATLLYVDLLEQHYIIDPRTYVYQLDINNLVSKKSHNISISYSKLCKEYNLPDFILSEKESISIQNFSRINIIDFVTQVLSFQTNYLYENLDEDIKLFTKFTNKKKKPKYLLAPYYLIDNNPTLWLDINLKLIKESMKLKKTFDNKVYAVLLITKDILSNYELIKEIIEKYSIADGLIFWIESFDEHNVSEEEIDFLIKFVKLHHKISPEKELISLYGGYFSQLLYHFGLSGVCHNLEYGENRSINPKGGQPTHKFYLPNIKLRIDPFEIIKILQNQNINTKNKFYSDICNCDICIKNINTDRIQEKFFVYLHDKDPQRKFDPSRDNCINHYLENKIFEFNSIEKKSLQELISENIQVYNNYIENNYLKGTNKVNITYMKKWSNTLTRNL